MASTYGVLASVSRRYAHRIPFLVKLNHNETLSYPTEYDQTLYASVEQAFNMGAVAVGATIYFGSEQSRRQIEEISAAFERAHELGMVTVLWAYLRNASFKKDGVDYHVSADLTGQANHLAATIGADIVKQKMAENNGGYKAVNFGYTDDRVYSKLTSDNPIDLVRYQLANCYMGRAGLINSGGAAGGFGLVLDVIVEADDFGTDEAALEVRVDDARGLRSLPAVLNGPRAHFLFSGGEVAGKAPAVHTDRQLRWPLPDELLRWGCS